MNCEMINSIINKYGTPLYLYDGDQIEHCYQALRGCLPRPLEIFYSVKANPLLGIGQMLQRLGAHAEVASGGELYIALKAGFKPQNIIFTSPGKTWRELEYAIEEDIYCINIETWEEAVLVNRIAGQMQKKARISVRINPDFAVNGAHLHMSGLPSQFGIDACQLDGFFQALTALNAIQPIGIHIYNGTQILNAQDLVDNAARIVELYLDLQTRYSCAFSFLDIGGGFGIPYFPEDQPLDLAQLRLGFERLWDQYGFRLSGTRLAVESGRFLVGDSGLFLTKILYQKECKTQRYIVCDGGYPQHPAAGFLGRAGRNRFEIVVLSKENLATEQDPIHIAGPCCTPIDLLGQNVKVPETVPGDILMVKNSGAYGLTNSPIWFLSHGIPAEVMVYQKTVSVLRKRGRYEDLLKGQHGLTLA